MRRIGPFAAQDFAAISTLGLEFAVAVALGVAAGYLADKRWYFFPWLTVAGACGGFTLGMYIIIRQAQRMGRAYTKGRKRDRSI